MNWTVAGIGEVLWDVFPDRRRLGGAPVNFACHCAQLGARGVAVSCVGSDSLGDALIRDIDALGVETDYLQRATDVPTGTVQVALDENGVPSYIIKEGVAWDVIRLDERLKTLAPQLDAVCFGSLAQRDRRSRESIQSFLERCRPDSVRIFDVNLRQKYYSRAVIEHSLHLATVLKVSEEELPAMADHLGIQGDFETRLRILLDRYGLNLVACTMGCAGSILIGPDATVRHDVGRTEVVDTVGAGDAFTATLCMGLLQETPLESIGQQANAIAAFVCSQGGSDPSATGDL